MNVENPSPGNNGEIKWDFVVGLLSNAIYGGRIDNTWDLRVLVAYLEHYFCPEVKSFPSSYFTFLSFFPYFCPEMRDRALLLSGGK